MILVRAETTATIRCTPERNSELNCVDSVRNSLELQVAAPRRASALRILPGLVWPWTSRDSFSQPPSYFIVLLNYSGSLPCCAFVKWAMEFTIVSHSVYVCVSLGDGGESGVGVMSEFTTKRWKSFGKQSHGNRMNEWINEQDMSATFNMRYKQAHWRAQATAAAGFIFITDNLVTQDDWRLKELLPLSFLKWVRWRT